MLVDRFCHLSCPVLAQVCRYYPWQTQDEGPGLYDAPQESDPVSLGCRQRLTADTQFSLACCSVVLSISAMYAIVYNSYYIYYSMHISNADRDRDRGSLLAS